MNLKTKANIFSLIIFLVIYTIVWVIIYYIFDRLNMLTVSAITAGVAVMLSPQEKIIETQSGKKVQLKWLFFDKVITIK